MQSKSFNLLSTARNSSHEELTLGERDEIRQHINRTAWLLDSAFRVPIINYRVGLDSLIGLVPGAGDLVGLGLSSYILVQAARLGVPRSTLVHMTANVLVETLVGIIPVIGDLFDFAFKANQRNVRLLNEALDAPEQTAARSRSVVARTGTFLVGSLVALGAGGVWLVRSLWMVLFGG